MRCLMSGLLTFQEIRNQTLDKHTEVGNDHWLFHLQREILRCFIV